MMCNFYVYYGASDYLLEIYDGRISDTIIEILTLYN